MGIGLEVSAAMVTVSARITASIPAVTPSSSSRRQARTGQAPGTAQSAHGEAADRDDRRERGEPVHAGQREREEHHVAGHVGHEDVPEDQVAERVDQPGDRGQRDQQRRQQPVLGAPGRRDRLPGVSPERARPRVTAHRT